MPCKVCGGEFVIPVLKCLNCNGGSKGDYCGTDGCPVFGNATEKRCKCDKPPPDLPIIPFGDALFHKYYCIVRCDGCNAVLSTEGQVKYRERNPTLVLCNECNHGRGEFIDDITDCYLNRHPW